MIIGITFSAFDLLHVGHIAMLAESAGQCDWLIAGLQVDPSIERAHKSAPLQSLFERYTQLAACRYVHEIVPYQHESEILDILSVYPIDRRFIGEEYKNADFTGKALCEQLNIEVTYNTRQHRFSSSELRQRLR